MKHITSFSGLEEKRSDPYIEKLSSPLNRIDRIEPDSLLAVCLCFHVCSRYRYIYTQQNKECCKRLRT